MNCVIIDDETAARIILSKICDEVPDLKVVAEYENPIEAIQFIEENYVDIIFLDIHMPNFTGFDFIKSLSVPPKIIITTSDRNLAIEAYEHRCIVDYLVKPILIPRFIKAIKKVRDSIKSESELNIIGRDLIEDDSLYINVDKRLLKIDISSIYLIEAKGDYIYLKTENKRYIVRSSLKRIQEKLSSKLFLRVHKSYIVNINKITGIEDNIITINKESVPIGRANRDVLIKRLNLL